MGSCLKSSQAAEMKEVLGRSLVAVKTCSKFHKDRLAAVKATWAPRVPHLEYISDSEDEDHPTKVLPFTVNTESGHCNKTMAIVNHFLEQEDKDILVIVDDMHLGMCARRTEIPVLHSG